MEENQQYLKYKNKLKQHCIVSAVASFISLLAGILLIFLPVFTIDLLKINADVSLLPKMHDLSPEILMSENPQLFFSVYDEVYAAIQLMTGAVDMDGIAAFSMSGIFQILGIVFLAAGVGVSIFSLVKNILHVVSPDNYALEMYDKIKHREELKIRRRSYYGSSSYWIIIGVVYEIFAIVFSTFMGRVAGAEYITSYFSLLSGVNGWCVLLIIVIAAAIGMFIWANVINNGIRRAILREEYSVGASAEQK